MEVVSQLEGAFALLIRSTRFPDELMAAKKGSPLLVGECPHANLE
jgi:glutamine---fructose-6-phosphate transaminase (isomerizing)